MTAEIFLELVTEKLGPSNPEQSDCLTTGIDVPAFIVAGPGSGKTRVLVLRALRHVCVDRILPEHIIITTFTKKAAKEIRSRLIQWGETLISSAITKYGERDPDLSAFLQQVDVNRFQTGTLDSLCEEALEISRTPAEPRYTLLDPYSARIQLSRKGQLSQARGEGDALDGFLAPFTFDGKPTTTVGEAAETLKPIADRMIHDLVDDAVYEDQSDAGRHKALQVVSRYSEFLEETAQVDFPRLEQMVLQRLTQAKEVGPLGEARAVLVDEYQDTNLLQEQIYFALVQRNHGALTVVGDDDQSLYRFRGATIELFRDFARRAEQALQCPPITPTYLTRNYRSSAEIVTFFNSFIKNDPDFSPGARVQPLKPEITPEANRPSMPILGFFRNSDEECAEAVAKFLHQVFEGDGFPIPSTDLVLRRSRDEGNYGDAVVLGKSVREFGRSFFGQDPKPKFPHHLRTELQKLGVNMFNPRGRPAHEITSVQQLLGLILASFDPQGNVVGAMALTSDAKRVFGIWRAAASALLQQNPTALDGKQLRAKYDEMRNLAGYQARGPKDIPVIDFIYAFIPYIPVFSDDPEHQVYLEGVSRAAAQLASFSSYRGTIIRDHVHNPRSLEGAIRDFLSPLATSDIEIDEDILQDVPRSSLNVMTIHQAKGLEFPMVLVDVSSEFKINNKDQRFKRFPESPSATTLVEDAFAPFCTIGTLRQQRTALQRTFEDIIREYYVAYSRAECALVLIGNVKTLSTKTSIRHLGQFWRADGTWAWTDGYPEKKPPSMAQLPFCGL